ncbi:hypothetical protein SUGI_0891470 [Cryptomeria japonica]|nr:hypothetical protein SUGI_0891470 [Cryptomeria japonica]
MKAIEDDKCDGVERFLTLLVFNTTGHSDGVENKDLGGEKCVIVVALASTTIAEVELISALTAVEVVWLIGSTKNFRGDIEILLEGWDYEHRLITMEFPNPQPTREEKEYSAKEFDGQAMMHEIGQTTIVVISTNGGAS